MLVSDSLIASDIVTEPMKKTYPTIELKYLPEYAAFLLRHHVKDFTLRQLQLFRELKVPLMRFFEKLPEEQLIERGMERVKSQFTFLAQNKAGEFIEDSIKNWLTNQSTLISRQQVSPEDIVQISFIRRKVFRDLLSLYTNDLNIVTQVMEELDGVCASLDAFYVKKIFEHHRDLYNQSQSIASLGSWVLDLKTDKPTWSDELFKIYGLQPQATVPDVASFNHSEDSEMIRAKIREARQTKKPFDFHYRIILSNGSEKKLHSRGSVLMDSRGDAYAMVGTVQDVTRQMQDEEELRKKMEDLRRNEERYHKMTEEVEDYTIILLNPKGFIMNWNKGAEKIKGYKAEEAIGKNFRIFYTPEDQQDELPERLIETAQKTGRVTHEGWRLRKNGTTYWGYTVITALHDENGKVIGFSKVTRDLTEKKVAEDMLRQYSNTLREKNKELEQSNKELESFTYAASHDLQEPLRKIKTFANFILNKEEEQFNDSTRDYFKRIMASVDRMQNLIESLLDFSRTSTGELLYEETDLSNVLREVEKDLSEQIEEKKATIESTPLPVLKVVPEQFQQLFANLISNALKYSKRDVPPHVKISAEIVPAKTLFPFFNEGKYYRICFVDNGIGFEQQYADKIFELFQRLHGKKEYSGTGIGLAICKKIVQNHNGFMRATGEPGTGARFEIFLPAPEEE